MKKILVACGNGIATSTMVATKIKENLKEKGLDVSTNQTKLLEVPGRITGYDLLVTTGKFTGDTKGVPVVQATSILTGIGADATYDEIYAELTNKED